MSNHFSLESIFSNKNDKTAVAISPESSKSMADLKKDCQNLISALRRNKPKEALLTCLDSYNFTVGFLSLLHENIKVCLPPGIGTGVVSEIKSERLLISDYQKDALHPTQINEGGMIELKTLTNGSISLFTSGSTGQRKEIKKRLQNFSDEIQVLESLWPINNHLTVATVSHHHIYGLLFKILWPLALGAPFYIPECLHESDLKSALEHSPECRLISCPAHLDTILKFNDISFLNNKKIFSSGAPLSVETSSEIKTAVGQSPVEVLGSTETGGIAWRQQTESSTWKALPRVELKTNNETLVIQSPFCEVTDDWYETSDKAELIDNIHFKHLGRNDRIVKVAGKRLSLDELENRLQKSDLITSCKIVILKEQGHSVRESCGAVIILSDKGLDSLKKLGRRKFANRLKQEVKPFYDPVLIPRFWRYVESFPVNRQGKVEYESLKTFFLGFDEKENRFPELLKISTDGNSIELKMTIPGKSKFFEGHFDEAPILPGVAQLFWVETYAKIFLGKSTVNGLNRLKFHKIIRPDSHAVLVLQSTGEKIDFKYVVNDEICSSGSLIYG